MADLSPVAQAIYDAFWSHPNGKPLVQDCPDTDQLVAALRAAAEQLPGVRWDGCIQPDAEISIGINWSRDALHAIAAELEGAGD